MDAVILSVHNRPDLDLAKTLGALLANDLTDTRVLIFDDGSDKSYERVLEFLEVPHERFEWHRLDTIADRPNTYHIDGHNNPAYVNNRALDATEGCDRLFWLSSDVILPPQALEKVRSWDLDECVYTPRVWDLKASGAWHGTHHPWPMMWFVACSRRHAVDCGGFDEKYLEGIGFEDNDFMGRLMMQSGRLVVDDAVTVVHQSHDQTAYSDEWEGFKRSEAYTLAKWGKVPFRENGDPLQWQEIPAANGKVLVMSLVGLNGKATKLCAARQEVAS